MKSEKKSLLSVHVAVLLFGLAGLFAKLVNLPAVVIVFGRVFCSSVFLLVLFLVQRKCIRLNERKDYVMMMIAGVILAVHWTTFMQSIQVSTVAIGTLTFSTFPLFVTFLEPWIFHEKLKVQDIMCALVMLAGVLLIVPEFHIQNAMTQGILWGMAGSLTYALLSLMNRQFSNNYSGPLVSLYEQGTAAVVLLPSLFILQPHASGKDIAGIVILGIACTATAHSLFIEGLKHVRVQTAGIIAGLESVYGILAAFLFLGENPSIKELAGGVVILGVAFYSTVMSQGRSGESQEKEVQGC